MIYYGKLFELMKKQGKNTTHIREGKIIGQETLRKLKMGTGILEKYDYKVPSKLRKGQEKILLIQNQLNHYVHG